MGTELHSSIYHLHIPRTSGVFLRNHILSEFRDKDVFASHKAKIDAKVLKSSYFVGGHFGLSPIDIMNNPTVFTILRNPIDRFISYFKYIYPQVFSDSLDSAFDRWINDESIFTYHSNSQTKFLSNTIDIVGYNQDLVGIDKILKNWFIGQNADIDKAKSFINNNNVYIMEDGKEIYKSLESLLGIRQFPHYFKVNTSDKLELNITKKQYDKIESLNILDLEIYEYARKN